MRDHILSFVVILACGIFLSATLTFAIPSHLNAKKHIHPVHLLSEPGLLQARDGNGLPTGTCNAQTPCPIAACCGTNGLCGYSPSECGQGNCTSKCTSKAECGQYGVTGKQNCPLNVCCSKFGCVDTLARKPSLIMLSGFAVQPMTFALSVLGASRASVVADRQNDLPVEVAPAQISVQLATTRHGRTRASALALHLKISISTVLRISTLRSLSLIHRHFRSLLWTVRLGRYTIVSLA
jgi:hypothetical protein